MDPTYLGQPVPAPYAQKPQGFLTKRMLMYIIGGLLIVIVGAFLLIAGGDNSAALQQTAKARQDTLLQLLGDGKKNIASESLAKVNGELYITLLSDDNGLQEAFTAAGLKKLKKEVVAAEADAETFQTLKTAKLNGQYDSAYRTALTQKLESHKALLKELHGKTKNKLLREAIAKEYDHLVLYLNTLEQLPS